MVRDPDDSNAIPEEFRIAIDRLGEAHSNVWDPVQVDERGRLVFFPLWPLGQRGYLVPDEFFAAKLREEYRRMSRWSRVGSWVPALLSFIVFALGLSSGWFFVGIGGDLVLVTVATLSWRRQVLRNLEPAPHSMKFGWRNRLKQRAAASGLPATLLLICVAMLMLAGSLFCLLGPVDRVVHFHAEGLFKWVVHLVIWVTSLTGVALFGLGLAALTYQAWFQVAHRDEVRLRRRASRLWG